MTLHNTPMPYQMEHLRMLSKGFDQMCFAWGRQMGKHTMLSRMMDVWYETLTGISPWAVYNPLALAIKKELGQPIKKGLTLDDLLCTSAVKTQTFSKVGLFDRIDPRGVRLPHQPKLGKTRLDAFYRDQDREIVADFTRMGNTRHWDY